MKIIAPERIGVMQGRLSAQENDLIQSFPWKSWQEEFSIAKGHKLAHIEWTVDSHMLRSNPICLEAYYKQIKDISNSCSVSYSTITGDFFMQEPFWKYDGFKRKSLLNNLDFILNAMARHSCKILVLPLVDNSSLSNEKQLSDLHLELASRKHWLRANNIMIAFETDLQPEIANEMIDKYPRDVFGINYDIGNSAALGFEPGFELSLIGNRVINVHIKDRIRNGGTVPLGTGDADIPKAVKCLLEMGYDGKFILQAARIKDKSPGETIDQYLEFMRDESLLGT